VDACTVTASDVTAAFATSDPNQLLAKSVGFFGSECPKNHFSGQSPSLLRIGNGLWNRPFGRRRKPDIGYALFASSCERVDGMDACTVSACYVITAFAASCPSLLLAELAGFFGPERPTNRFAGSITQSIRSVVVYFNCLSTVDACDPNSAK
jgi:hypothetical protein